jgi:hypothetical protein
MSLRSRLDSINFGGVDRILSIIPPIPVSAFDNPFPYPPPDYTNTIFGLNPLCDLIESLNGEVLYSSSNCVIAIDIITKKQRIFSAGFPVRSFTLSKDGNTLAIGISGCKDNLDAKIILIDYWNGKKKKTFSVCGSGLMELCSNGLSFNLDRNILAAAGKCMGASFIALIRTSETEVCSNCETNNNVKIHTLSKDLQVLKPVFSPFDVNMLCVSLSFISVDEKESGILQVWHVDTMKGSESSSSSCCCCCCATVSKHTIDGFNLLHGTFTDLKFEPSPDVGSSSMILLKPPGLDFISRGKNLIPYSLSLSQNSSDVLPVSFAGPGLPPSRLISTVRGEESFENRAILDRSKPASEKTMRLFATTSTGSVAQINLTTRRVDGIFRLHDGPIQAITLSTTVLPSVNLDFGGMNSSQISITCDSEGVVRIWDSSFSENLWQAKLSGSIKTCLVLKQQVMSNSASINRWKSRSERTSSNIKLVFIADCNKSIHGCRLGIIEARLSADVISYAPIMTNRNVLLLAESHSENIISASSVLVAKDRSFVGTIGRDASIMIWPIVETKIGTSMNAILRTDGYINCKTSTCHVTCLALRHYTEDSSYIGSNSRLNQLHIDHRLGLSLDRMYNKDQEIPPIEAAIGFSDGTIDIVHVNSNTVTRSVRLHTPGTSVSNLLYSSLGTTLFSVGTDGLLVATNSRTNYRIISAVAGPVVGSTSTQALVALSPKFELISTWFSRFNTKQGFFSVMRLSDMEIVANSIDLQLPINIIPQSICCVNESGDIVAGCSDGTLILLGFKTLSLLSNKTPSSIQLLSRPLLSNLKKSAVVSVNFYAPLNVIFFALDDGRRGHIGVTELRCNTIETETLNSHLIDDGICYRQMVLSVESSSRKCILVEVDSKSIMISLPFYEADGLRLE